MRGVRDAMTRLGCPSASSGGQPRDSPAGSGVSGTSRGHPAPPGGVVGRRSHGQREGPFHFLEDCRSRHRVEITEMPRRESRSRGWSFMDEPPPSRVHWQNTTSVEAVLVLSARAVICRWWLTVRGRFVKNRSGFPALFSELSPYPFQMRATPVLVFWGASGNQVWARLVWAPLTERSEGIRRQVRERFRMLPLPRHSWCVPWAKIQVFPKSSDSTRTSCLHRSLEPSLE